MLIWIKWILGGDEKQRALDPRKVLRPERRLQSLYIKLHRPTLIFILFKILKGFFTDLISPLRGAGLGRNGRRSALVSALAALDRCMCSTKSMRQAIQYFGANVCMTMRFASATLG